MQRSGDLIAGARLDGIEAVLEHPAYRQERGSSACRTPPGCRRERPGSRRRSAAAPRAEPPRRCQGCGRKHRWSCVASSSRRTSRSHQPRAPPRRASRRSSRSRGSRPGASRCPGPRPAASCSIHDTSSALPPKYMMSGSPLTCQACSRASFPSMKMLSATPRAAIAARRLSPPGGGLEKRGSPAKDRSSRRPTTTARLAAIPPSGPLPRDPAGGFCCFCPCHHLANHPASSFPPPSVDAAPPSLWLGRLGEVPPSCSRSRGFLGAFPLDHKRTISASKGGIWMGGGFLFGKPPAFKCGGPPFPPSSPPRLPHLKGAPRLPGFPLKKFFFFFSYPAPPSPPYGLPFFLPPPVVPLRDLHRAECAAAHRAEVRDLGALRRQGLVVELARGVRDRGRG